MVIPLASATLQTPGGGGLKSVNRGGTINKDVALEMGFTDGSLIRKVDDDKYVKVEYTLEAFRAKDCLVSDGKGKQFALTYTKLLEYKVYTKDESASERQRTIHTRCFVVLSNYVYCVPVLLVLLCT